MAKQSGLHQIRGKVGEHSYYRQTGVQSGLIRSINQGMSARVKTSEEYANVRLNNAEFGQAGRIASVLGQYISPKFRPMVLPFSQSKMAKIILEYIKNDSTAPWGQRNIIQTESGDVQVAALNSVVKNRFGDFGISLTVDDENTTLTAEFTAESLNKLSAIGANGVVLRFLVTNTWIGMFNPSTSRYLPSTPSFNAYENVISDPSEGETADFIYSLPPSPPQRLPIYAAVRTGIFIVLPYRTLNGQNYILQEQCTFKAFVIADGPVG